MKPGREERGNYGSAYATWGDWGDLSVTVDRTVDLRTLMDGIVPGCRPTRINWSCGGDGSIESAKAFAARLNAAIEYAEKLEDER